METERYGLFETALGPLGLVWRGSKVSGLLLPDSSKTRLEASLRRRFPGALPAEPPARIRAAIAKIQAALRGEGVRLDGIEIDLDQVTAFRRRVYEAARALGRGETCSYGELASKMGTPGAARAVGGALGENPIALLVPCHRVLGSRGALGGFTAPGGTETKSRLLALEGYRPPAKAPRRANVDEAVAHLRRVDRKLARIMDKVGPYRPRRDKTKDVFDALARAIVHQQLSEKAAATIWGRFEALFGALGPSAQGALRLSRVELRGAGLSEAKTLSVLDLARHIDEGRVPTLRVLTRLGNDEVIEKLTIVRGVGRWTAEMFLIFRLGRGDVLPLDDLGIQKGFARVMGRSDLPSKIELAAWGERWAPYRSIASYFLWRATELP
jgi:O-6-methylguanine DNA methyltransferase